jgi:hypothetical protein
MIFSGYRLFVKFREIDLTNGDGVIILVKVNLVTSEVRAQRFSDLAKFYDTSRTGQRYLSNNHASFVFQTVMEIQEITTNQVTVRWHSIKCSPANSWIMASLE